MATKSILKDVRIKEAGLAHTFVKALEEAKSSKSEPTKISRECIELSEDKIKSFFGK